VNSNNNPDNDLQHYTDKELERILQKLRSVKVEIEQEINDRKDEYCEYKKEASRVENELFSRNRF